MQTTTEADASKMLTGIANTLAHSITWEDDVWRADPFDVPQVHLEARVKFADTLAAVARQDRSKPRVLLFHGQSGAGKTHLVRALRTQTHRLGQGYFGYAQMTPDVGSYVEYFLRRLINALEKPYAPFKAHGSGLRQLSDALIDDPEVADAEKIQWLQDGEFTDLELAAFISDLSDAVISSERFFDTDIDVNTVRALLYLQRNEPRVDQRVRQYLCGRQLNQFSHASVAALDQNAGQDRSFEIIEALGQIMWATGHAALVMCIDQVEDLRFYDNAEERFQSAVMDLIQIASRVPSAVVVISCLTDFYTQVRDHLPQSYIDRIEKSGPVLLAETRTVAEAEQVLGARIAGARDPGALEDPARAPRLRAFAQEQFGAEFFASAAGMSTRKLLEHAAATIDAQLTGQALPGVEDAQTGAWCDQAAVSPHATTGQPAAHGAPFGAAASGSGLQVMWERHCAQFACDLEGEDEAVVDLVLSGLELYCREQGLPVPQLTLRDEIEGVPAVSYTIAAAEGNVSLGNAMLYFCNKASQGGALKRQIDALLSGHPGGPMVVARASAFPPQGKSATGQAMKQLQLNGAVRVQVQLYELTQIAAATAFDNQQGAAPGYVHWLQENQPLAQMVCLRDLLGALGHPLPQAPVIDEAPAVAARTPQSALPVAAVSGMPAHAGLGDRIEAAADWQAPDELPPLPSLYSSMTGDGGVDAHHVEHGHADDSAMGQADDAAGSHAGAAWDGAGWGPELAGTDIPEDAAIYDPLAAHRIDQFWSDGAASGAAPGETADVRYDAGAFFDPEHPLSEQGLETSGAETVGNDGNSFDIGVRIDDRSVPVNMSKNVLKRHAAMLGGSGSGKTTLALTVVEQLLMSGVPVVLIDRKGDLCSYAKPDVWRDNPKDTEDRNGIRGDLASMIDVAVYTPGRTSGRPIGITLLPNGIGELPEHEQQELANVSAAAIGDMLHLKNSATHQRQRGILAVALKILGGRAQGEVTLAQLIAMLENDDEELVELTQRMDPSGKLRRDLIGQLDALRHRNWALFEGGGEPMSMEALLGKGEFAPPEQRTRLSVVYTGFLGDNENILFWVSQFLSEALRFCQRNPNDELQAVLLFDEADLYIPANGRPATSEPLQSLLKRARSAGVGVILATQSPGDLDYRSRDQITSWFIGRVREDTALRKLRAAFAAESGIDPAQVLPNQTVGEFHLIQEGDVTPIKSAMSLIKADQVPFDRIEQLAQQTGGGSNKSQLDFDI
ncbi:MAG: helicase HerA-like domain-containing protein [Pseudomonadota bacterium]